MPDAPRRRGRREDQGPTSTSSRRSPARRRSTAATRSESGGRQLRLRGEERWPQPTDRPITLIRFANRVPLLYQQAPAHLQGGRARPTGAATGWASRAGACRSGRWCCWSTWPRSGCPSPPRARRPSPTTRTSSRRSSSRLQECGRKLATFLRRKERGRYEAQRRSIFELYIGELAPPRSASSRGQEAAGRRSRARSSGGEVATEEAEPTRREHAEAGATRAGRRSRGPRAARHERRARGAGEEAREARGAARRRQATSRGRDHRKNDRPQTREARRGRGEGGRAADVDPRSRSPAARSPT